nr:MAG TPA: hypothetical protein [Caudoviricetes sp.]
MIYPFLYILSNKSKRLLIIYYHLILIFSSKRLLITIRNIRFFSISWAFFHLPKWVIL